MICLLPWSFKKQPLQKRKSLGSSTHMWSFQGKGTFFFFFSCFTITWHHTLSNRLNLTVSPPSQQYPPPRSAQSMATFEKQLPLNFYKCFLSTNSILEITLDIKDSIRGRHSPCPQAIITDRKNQIFFKWKVLQEFPKSGFHPHYTG